MTKKHQNLLNVLREHKGKSNAIRSQDLQAMLGHRDATIRRLVRELSLDYNIIVCSSVMGSHRGFYLPKNDDEIREYVGNLISRVRGINRRIRVADRHLAKRIDEAMQQELPL